jgi:hypothetical protein
MSSDKGGFEGAAAGALIGIFVVVVVVVLIVGFWLAVRIINCLIRAFLISPRSKALWLTTGGVVASLVLARVTGGIGAFYISAAVSFLALLISAKAIQLSNDPLYQAEPSREHFVDELLHKNWWPQAA